MFKLFDKANEQDDDNWDEDVRHEENNPAGEVRVDSVYFEQHKAANEICVEENEFHQQDEKNELQSGFIIRDYANFLQLFVDFMHDQKPLNELLSLH